MKLVICESCASTLEGKVMCSICETKIRGIFSKLLKEIFDGLKQRETP